MQSFLYSFQSEWLKRRRSAASTLVWAGSFFIPVIVLISRFDNIPVLSKVNASPHAWELLFNRHWQFMGLFLLPMGVILATSLVTQLEFKNNTWKQVHVTPQPLSRIFWAKLAVIGLMLLQFFILFNIGIFLTGVLPAIFIGAVHYPVEPFPLLSYLRGNGYFLIDCLPIVALQFLVSLQCRNFLLPLGMGIGLFVASMMAMMWKYGYIVPYVYCAMNFHQGHAGDAAKIHYHYWALTYFAIFTMLGYILYLRKKDKS